MFLKTFAALTLVSLGTVFAQKPEALPAFEVASIKPAAPMQSGRMMVGVRGGPGTPEPGQMTFTNVSLSNLIQKAYDVKDYQVTGPDWLDSVRFDISAKVPAGTTKAQSLLMMQSLLAERFKLVLHHSSKEASIYALLVGKNGPKLTVSAPESADAGTTPAAAAEALRTGPPAMGKDGMPQLPKGAGRGGAIMMMTPGGRMRLTANGTTVSHFLDALGSQLDRPAVDMTGLTGTYDITFDFTPDPAIMQAKMAAMGVQLPPEVAGHAAADDSNSPSVFTALQEQLGLRLEARKGPVDLLVVDSVQKTPTEN